MLKTENTGTFDIHLSIHILDLKDKVFQLNNKIEELEEKVNDNTLEIENKCLRKERDDLIVQVNMNQYNKPAPFGMISDTMSDISDGVDKHHYEFLKLKFDEERKKLVDERTLAEETTIRVSAIHLIHLQFKLESFKLHEEIYDLKDELKNLKEVQKYFEELVKHKSKEVSDLRQELLTLKNLYEKQQKVWKNKSILSSNKSGLSSGKMNNPASDLVSFILIK